MMDGVSMENATINMESIIMENVTTEKVTMESASMENVTSKAEIIENVSMEYLSMQNVTTNDDNVDDVLRAASTEGVSLFLIDVLLVSFHVLLPRCRQIESRLARAVRQCVIRRLESKTFNAAKNRVKKRLRTMLRPVTFFFPKSCATI